MSEHMIKVETLRKRSDEELNKQLDEFKQELLNLRFQHHTGQLENVSRMRHVKRNIARVKTIVCERERVQLTSSAE